MKRLLSLFCFLLLGSSYATASIEDGQPYSVSVDQAGYIIDGQYTLLRGGSLQWFRLPQASWRDRLKRFKAAGFNTIDMYVAWNQIEKQEGQFDFESPDIRHFLELAQELELYVYFRPGPYITNELDGGGVPGWLMHKTTKKRIADDGLVNARTHDPDFIYYVKRYLNTLNEVVKPYLASNGGPIILYSLENEYNWFETFHEVDKLFWFEGGPERDLLATFPTRAYFETLRDIVWNDGIDVPLTTCPGDGKASATGDVAGIIPMPNVYNGLGGELPEKVAFDLLQDMHNPANHGGEYVNFPSGTTETDREPSRIKRMLMGGFDATFAFNIAGMHQEGYMNSVVLDVNGDTVNKVLDFSSVDNIITGFVSPTVGYFHNVIDYNGAISPSGLLRDKFYAFRRDNLFFNSVESRFAASTHPRRSGNFSGADDRLRIDSDTLGAVEGQRKIHYWHATPQGSRFISLVNQSGTDQQLAAESIELEGLTFPRFSNILVPVEAPQGPGQFGDTDNSSSMIISTHLPYGNALLEYSSSEILHLADFNGDPLLVVHGKQGSNGEIQLKNLSQDAQLVFKDTGVTINEFENGLLNFSYDHDSYQHLIIHNGGRRLRVLISNTDDAGRMWFFEKNGKDIMVAGPDYIDSDSLQMGTSTFEFVADYGVDSQAIMIMAPQAFTRTTDITPSSTYNPVTLARHYLPLDYETVSAVPNTLLTQGHSQKDNHETHTQFQDSNWQHWQGQPRSLEQQGIIKGHAWYRAELHLNGWNWLPFWEPTDLYIEHASDILGIYVNGTYLTTLSPMGTELDSDSWNRRYQFPSLRPYLKKGKNVIAFRTEIWGHGSFMFPRGKLSATQAQMPAVGFDSEKGLFGEARVGWRKLENWSVREDLGGQISGYQNPGFDTQQWSASSIPLQLDKGDIRWYRSEFDSASLPAESSIHAPIALALKGKNTKATIYVNGRLIGRWISDTQWLNRGFWGRVTRNMWMNTSPDHFPVSRDILKPAGQKNVVAIAFEDTSSDTETAGNIESLRLQFAEENEGKTAIKNRKTLGFSWQ